MPEGMFGGIDTEGSGVDEQGGAVPDRLSDVYAFAQIQARAREQLRQSGMNADIQRYEQLRQMLYGAWQERTEARQNGGVVHIPLNPIRDVSHETKLADNLEKAHQEMIEDMRAAGGVVCDKCQGGWVLIDAGKQEYELCECKPEDVPA